jgi:hypothetical protein
MRKLATVRRVPLAPTDDDFLFHLAADALVSVIAELRCRVQHTSTRRQVAQVLLAGAHIDEAVGLLRAIQSAPSPYELGVGESTTPPARRARCSLLRAGCPHPARAVGI